MPPLAIAAWLAVAVLLAIWAAYGTDAQATAAGVVQGITYGALLMAMVTLGVPITRREPHNPIGWIFCATPVLVGISVAGGSYADAALADGRHAPVALAVGLTASASWVLGLLAFVLFVPLLFPDGRPPGRRWRVVARLDAAALGVVGLVIVLQPGATAGGADNPIGLPALSSPVVLGAVVIAVVALIVAGLVSAVVRYRRAGAVERLQLRACVFAACATVAGFLVISVVYPASGLYTLDYALVPLAVGFAMLRHGLYDVDVIIRRTLVYACLVAVLAAIYLAGIAIIGTGLRSLTGSSGSVAVTLSTLAVAVAFQPLRRRIRTVVDRRFYRSRYDSRAVVDAYAGHLRQELDVDAMCAGLLTVIAETVRPTHAGVWIRPPTRS